MIERVQAGLREGPLIKVKENVLQTRFQQQPFILSFFCQVGTLTRGEI